ncbi:MAG: cyclic nucleotide-binding/CBS domain-containing protein [Candidatus Natronoplasma sp.]
MEDEERFRGHEVLVQDVMSKNPVVINENETVERAANLMKEADIGSLVVVDDDQNISGIITEMDIVKKIVAENLPSDDVRIKEVMSKPVHTIDVDRLVQEAAETMAEKNIRRLPVMENGEMIGIITENDVLEISPTLIDITREYERIRGPNDLEKYEEHMRRESSGYCESCGVYSDRLVPKNGQLLCPECE